MIMTARGILALCLAALIFAGGCFKFLERPAPVRPRLFTVGTPQPADAPETEKPLGRLTAGIRPFDTAAAIEERILVRVSPVKVEYLEHDRWAEPPAEMVTRAFHQALEHSGLFAGVFPTREMPVDRSALQITGSLERFEIDESDGVPRARINVVINVRRMGDRAHVWRKVFSQNIETGGGDSEDYASAMQKALENMLGEFLQEMTPHANSAPDAEKESGE